MTFRNPLTPRATWIVAAVVVVIVLIVAWNFDPFGRRKRADARADHAEQSETLTKGAARANEKAQAKEIDIRGVENEAVNDGHAQPGADRPLPPGVRDAFKRGVDGVRNPKGPDNPHR